MTSWFVQGIDISRWQPYVDFRAAARGGIWFAFIKASEGTYPDAKFTEHWAGSRGLLLRGPYVFFRPDIADEVSIETQIRTMYNTVSKTGDLGELPPVLDAERTPCTWEQIAEAMDWMEQLFGRQPLLYTSLGFVQELGPPPNWVRQKNWPLWIAQYTDAPQPILPEGWDTWVFWQYTSQGRIPGYDGNIDRNRFNGSLRQLFEFAGMTQDEAVWWRLNRLEYMLTGVAVSDPPTEIPGAGVPYRVTAFKLRVRKGPGVQYPTVGLLDQGEIVYVKEINNEGQAYAPWGRIGEERWISLLFAEPV